MIIRSQLSYSGLSSVILQLLQSWMITQNWLKIKTHTVSVFLQDLIPMHKSRCSSFHTSFHKYLLLFAYIYRYICISNGQWKLYWPPGTSSSGPTQRKRPCFFLLKCKPTNMFHHLHNSECQQWWWREGLALVLTGGCVCAMALALNDNGAQLHHRLLIPHLSLLLLFLLFSPQPASGVAPVNCFSTLFAHNWLAHVSRQFSLCVPTCMSVHIKKTDTTGAFSPCAHVTLAQCI